MAVCAICGKKPISGNKISIARSHVSRRAPRTWKPNLRSVKAEIDGEVKRVHVCAKCLRNGNVKRVS
ncbi:MAG: 50S ribosomal protein L28 [Clostridia bacterium]|nr:50S ribosomal protein L28 [Clostridia bacterium]